MNKLIAVLLSVVLCLCALTPVMAQETPLAGGWQAAEDMTVTPEAQQALDKALEGFAGSSITPVALLGTQVVAGINYCLLCKIAPVVPNPQFHYALVYVYSPVAGQQPQLLRIQDIELSAQEKAVEDDGQDGDPAVVLEPASGLFRLDSVGTIEPEEGTEGKTVFCADGYWGSLIYEGSEDQGEFVGFEEQDFDRLLLKDDLKAEVPVDLNNPVENKEIIGAAAFEAWWRENIEEKNDPSVLFFTCERDDTDFDFVTKIEYRYIP